MKIGTRQLTNAYCGADIKLVYTAYAFNLLSSLSNTDKLASDKSFLT